LGANRLGVSSETKAREGRGERIEGEPSRKTGVGKGGGRGGGFGIDWCRNQKHASPPTAQTR